MASAIRWAGCCAVILCSIGLSLSCTNNYGKFYRPISQESFPPQEFVEVRHLPAEDAVPVMEEGYMPIGESIFQSRESRNERAARKQGKRVGADLVLLSSRIVGEETFQKPVTQYHPSKTYTANTHGNASAFDSRGRYVYGHSNATSTYTEPGYTTTTYVPVTYKIYENWAGYFKRLEPGTTTYGFLMRDPDPADREDCGVPTGVLLWVVFRDGIARGCGLRSGDIVTHLNGKPVLGYEQFNSDLGEALAAGSPTLRICRDGQAFDVEFSAPSRP